MPSPTNHDRLKRAISRQCFEWRQHTLQRITERGLLQDDIIRAIMEGEVIEDYPADFPFPSALFSLTESDTSLHVVVAYDESNDWAYIITAYRPDLKRFEPDMKTRRKR